MVEESYTKRMWNDYLSQVKELKERGFSGKEIAKSMHTSPLLVDALLVELVSKKVKDERTNSTTC
jgi:orotate phosphoribosyltransferase-like protein